MARKRTVSVREPLELLTALEEQYAGTRESVRVRFLRMLKEHPSLGLAEIAATIDIPMRSVERWWRTYRDGGIAHLLPALPSTGANTVRQLQSWFRAHYDLQLTESDAALFMEAGLRPESLFEEEELGHASAKPDHAGENSRTTRRRFIEGLNKLSTSVDPVEWSYAVRDALMKFLPDIDRVVTSVNMVYDAGYLNPAPFEGRFRTADLYPPGSSAPQAAVKMRSGPSKSNLDEHLEMLRSKGFPFQQHHAPYGREYYLGTGEYVGVLIFFRECHRSPISSETLEIIESLDPFIIFLFTDFVARHRSNVSERNTFGHAIRYLVEAGLTEREFQIALLRLRGLSYKEIAGQMAITERTVKTHMQAVYRKTGVSGSQELAAMSFGARLPDQTGRHR